MSFFSWLKKFLKMLKEFGLSVALASAISSVCKVNMNNPKRRIAVWVNEWKHLNIEKYLYREIEDILENYSNKLIVENDKKCEKNIWTMWWQGEKNMPEEIEICLKSIRRFSEGHKLIVITRENIDQYISFPDYIKRKIDLNIISYTHLSDLVRIYLIKNYGGLWLDATVFVSGKIPEGIFHYTYYTNKLIARQMACVSRQRWAGYILAGKPDNIYCSFMLDCFYKYWETEEMLIDYFLIDYLTDIAYDKLTNFRNLYNDLEIGNVMINQLEKICNNIYDPQILTDLFANHVFFKLQRRNIHKKCDLNGKETFYGYIANMYANIKL